MEASLPHILVVDDDNRLRDLLRKYLSENGYVVLTATGAQDARDKLGSFVFDLIILDLMMPGETGLEFAADFRTSSNVPILMLTAMSESEDRIRGLEHGADDYLTKPFEPRELLLRVTAILKRVSQPVESATEPQAKSVSMGQASFDSERGELTVNNDLVRLTTVEIQLLRMLAERPGEPLSREALMDDAAGGGRAVDVQVTRLRKKIERDPKMPRYLQTVRGKGYVLIPD
ncbi:MAG: DNA-binding response regulator [Rhodospirillaceae bacterium]|nr:MAG: DNA-binding response regulator [Rhodospirillaceae bacterium]